MVSIFFVGETYSKIIDHEDEGDGSGGMSPQPICVWGLVVADSGQSFGQEFVGQHACLGKSIHSFLDLNVDPSIFGDNVLKVVLIYDFLRDHADVDAHILVSLHGGVEIEVPHIHGHKLGFVGGEDMVDEDFGEWEIRCSGADISWILDEVATDG